MAATPDLNKIKQDCDDCCNKLRAAGCTGSELQRCEALSNKIASAHTMQSSGATATVGGVASPDWAALFQEAMTLLPLILAFFAKKTPTPAP